MSFKSFDPQAASGSPSRAAVTKHRRDCQCQGRRAAAPEAPSRSSSHGCRAGLLQTIYAAEVITETRSRPRPVSADKPQLARRRQLFEHLRRHPFRPCDADCSLRLCPGLLI